MQDKNIEQLIDELQTLRIQQAAIISEIKQAIREETEQNGHNERESKTRKTSEHRVRLGSQEATEFALKNKVKKPATAGPAWSESRERLATVTKVVRADLIHIRTDNGTATWRAPNNLEVIN